MSMIEEQVRVSMGDPAALKKWLTASGRKYVLMNSGDLVDSLSWPEGVTLFQGVVDQYRAHRQTLVTGRVEVQKDKQGNSVEVPIMKGEELEIEEKVELYLQLQGELLSAGVLP